jgi:pimeloyl-ACP methyl ester carboxylesterase
LERLNLATPSRRAILAAGLLLAACGGAASSGAVRRERYVDVGDARLYTLVRGDDPNAPLLIWLHGGPGGAERPLFQLYNSDLERRFLVVYLDQRGTARSYNPDADPRRLTVARHVADLDVVVDGLRREFAGRPVILMGHSWGSALALFYAKAHPEKVAAVVGVGQVSNEVARQRSQYEFVEAEARRRGESEVLERLYAIGPPPFSARREIAVQRLVERYGGYFRKEPNLLGLLVRAMGRGYVRPWEIKRLFRGNAVSLEAMNDELLKLDLPRDVREVKVPVVFMLGRYDRQVDSRLAAAYFGQLNAPAKRLMWFEDSAHNAPFEEPARFNAAVPRLLAEVGAIPRASP